MLAVSLVVDPTIKRVYQYLSSSNNQGVREGGSEGTWYPGLGGPERVQISALSFCSSPFFRQKIELNFSEDLFFAVHLIVGINLD